MAAERRFRAMGSVAHVIVVGGPRRLIDDAIGRVDDLERRWSRFLPDSEVSQLNRWAGIPVAVSADTITLVEHAVVAWRLSGGAFDPTVLGAVIRAGYDRSFERLGATPESRPGPLGLGAGGDPLGLGAGGDPLGLGAGGDPLGLGAGGDPSSRHGVTPVARHSPLGPGADAIVINRETVTLSAGTGFDPGGIGKGLAADLVCAEMMAAGAEGICVNLGGDVKVAGAGPDGGCWTVAVEPPGSTQPLVNLGLIEGAVATSTTLLRRWQVDGERRHHLIDPQTGLPSDTDLTVAAVVAGQAWMAEVLAKAVLLAGAAHPFDIVGRTGAEALAVDRNGAVHATEHLSDFLGDQSLPDWLPVGDRPLVATMAS